MASGALSTLDDDAAIAEIASGTLTKTIAERYGVAKQSLHERLQKHPRYKQAIEAQAESLVEQATSEAMGEGLAASMPDIARARLRVDTAHKWAAARDPARWGTRTQVDLNVSGPLVAITVAAMPIVQCDATADPYIDGDCESK